LDRFYRRAHLFIDHRATRPAGHRARPCSACSESAGGRQCHARQEDGRRRRSLASSRAPGQRAASIEATQPSRPSPPEASPATRMILAAASVRTSPRRRGRKPPCAAIGGECPYNATRSSTAVFHPASTAS
jgi:hypothetical protein